MLYKYGKRRREFLGRFLFYSISLYFGCIFYKTNSPLVLIGYEMMIAKSALG